MGYSLDETHQLLGLAYDADRLNTSPISEVVSAKRFKKVRFLAFFSDAGGTGDGTLKVQASAAFDGSSPVDVDFRYQKSIANDTMAAKPATVLAGSTVAITANLGYQLIVCEVLTKDLPHGFDKVFLKLAEVTNEPVPGFVLIEMLEPDLTEADGLFPTQVA